MIVFLRISNDYEYVYFYIIIIKMENKLVHQCIEPVRRSKVVSDTPCIIHNTRPSASDKIHAVQISVLRRAYYIYEKAHEVK